VEKAGKNAILTFSISGKAITDDNYAAKLLGKTKDGKLLFGYALLPWVSKTGPIMSARLPVITPNSSGYSIKVHVDNYGQLPSVGDNLLVTYTKDGQQIELGKGRIMAGIKPFTGLDLDFKTNVLFEKDVPYDFTITINPENKTPILLHGKITPAK